MRVLLLAAALLLAVSSEGMSEELGARGHTAHPEEGPALRIPTNLPVARSKNRSTDLPVNSQIITAPAATRAPTMLHIGPIQAERVDGQTRYRVEGVEVLGGGVSGTVSGNGAKVFLRWPTNN